MKQILCLSLFLMSQPVLAQGLPKHFSPEGMGISVFPVGEKVPVNMTLHIPDGYKINFSPKLNVYEKKNGKWKLNHTIEEKGLAFTRVGNKIQFHDHAKFTSADSNVALDLSVSFCKKICVINNFQSEFKRDKRDKKEVVYINVKGWLPQDKVKEEFKKPNS